MKEQRNSLRFFELCDRVLHELTPRAKAEQNSWAIKQIPAFQISEALQKLRRAIGEQAFLVFQEGPLSRAVEFYTLYRVFFDSLDGPQIWPVNSSWVLISNRDLEPGSYTLFRHDADEHADEPSSEELDITFALLDLIY